ncbi:C4-dicarboxylate ABC transporter permease [Clostridium sp. chh4-2]|uniref:tripartite tricarboxylate transporter permease n=1 Tax=Clostridium sp. chh4-2 TaxID=2067550 RepID=UPI000CCF2FF2|nr:tripartite tricarboxylate transporter permease [Clostridium sp. chh4-2]PNV61873.1 C4-dicarboxylate ABC transporter permease [Clostridium sp. chh4-2]
MFQYDFSLLLTAENLALIFIGSFIGLLVGSMPGLGTALAIVLLLPFSYGMKALSAIVMLLAAYQGAEYGGSISSITLGIPGTPSAAATALDGYAMSKKGEPGKALHYSLFASAIGGLFGAFALLLLTKPLAEFSLRFNAPDYCMLGLIAIIAIITISSTQILKGLISVLLGLMLCTVGTDSFTGASRFTLGIPGLVDGIYTVSMAVAIFAVPEILSMVSESLNIRYVSDAKQLKSRLSAKEYFHVAKPILSGATMGTVIGIFPGLGGAIASWLSLLFTTKTSRHPENFGKGEPQGIAAPESANNACVAGSLIPELALGIPGAPAVAIIASAFMIHGIKVGPSLFSTDPELLNGIYYGFFLSVAAMYILGRLLTPFFARILSVPGSVLVPVIMVFLIIGTYAGKKNFVHLWIALAVGIICYFLKRMNYPLAPIMIAYVIGPLIESNFRRSLELSGGSLDIFVQSVCSKVIFSLLIFVIIFPWVKRLWALSLEKIKKIY